MSVAGILNENSGRDRYTVIALVVSLVLYPMFYSLGFSSNVLLPILPDELIALLSHHPGRARWWSSMLSIAAFHWVSFFFIWYALYKNKESWNSIGLNFQWYVQRKYWFIGLLCILIVAAFVMPGIHYGDQFPQRSNTHSFLGPVTTFERLFMIFTAVTAGVTEEVIFRGFAFNRLKRWIPNPWVILPITLVSFSLIHAPDSVGDWINYTVAGCVFGIPFILMKLRRLEILILIHFLIDAGLVIAP